MKMPQELYSSLTLSASAATAIPVNPQIPDENVTAQRCAFVSGAIYARDLVAIVNHPIGPSVTEQSLRELLREVRDDGLIYWEPQSSRGHVSKRLMFAKIDAALEATGGPLPLRADFTDEATLAGMEKFMGEGI